MNQDVTATRRAKPTTLARGALAAAVSVAILVPPAAFAQVATTMPAGDSAAPQAPATRPAGNVPLRGVTTSPQGMTFNFQDVSIDTILNELSQAAGFIVVKEVKPEGRVTLVSRQPVSNEDAVSLLNTVLRNAGYAAIQQDRILKIVNRDAAKRLNIPVRTGSDPTKVANTDELITQVIPLRYADATLLKTDLAPLIDSETPFTSNASSNVLIMTDTSANIRRIVTIVNALDTSVADAVDVKVFPLKFANATSAATLINSVFANLNSSRTQGSAESGQGGGGGGAPGGFPGFGGGGGFGQGRFGGFGQNRGGNNNQQRSGGQRLVTAGADERTNSVVVSGQSDTLQIVASVIKELDANPAAEETMFVYRLRNAQALNVESTLNGLFTGQPPTNRTQQDNAQTLRSNRSTGTLGSTSSSGGTNRGSSSNGRTTAARATGNTGTGGNRALSNASQNAASSLAGQVTLIADTDSNSLLIRTSPTNYAQVKSILDEIDKPVAQVLIKVLIAEVTHRNDFDAGFNFSALNTRANGRGVSGGTGLFDGAVPAVGSGGSGLVVQVLEENFTAALRALELTDRVDVLSRPYILASDNQLASIVVGSEVPFVDSSRITDTGNQINTVDYRDVGILLDVIPHINPDGLVILDVAPEISSLNRESGVVISDGVTAPLITKRSAQSRVSVRDGRTIVIGGLMQDQLSETIRKVPLLGDIPGIGELFKSRTRSKTKTELLIFLTPHVAAEPADLETMSKDEQQGMRLVPNAVEPGAFQEHMEGLRRGDAKAPVGPSTQQSAIADPTTMPAPFQIYDESKVRGDRRNYDRPPENRDEPVDPDQPRP